MTMLRFLRFNVVSALGVLVQLSAVSVLVSGLGVHYLVGAALAIELAVLHNFAWHERWTWREHTAEGHGRKAEGRGPFESAETRLAQAGRRPDGDAAGGARSSVFFRCLVFHAGNGCVSLLGSLALLPVLVGALHLHYLVANLATIAATGLLNFLISDRLVFAPSRGPEQAV